MDSDGIGELLNKYWRCETSLEEEQRLQAYFIEAQSVPDQFKDAAALFKYFQKQKRKALNDAEFDREVIKKMQAPAKGRISTLVFNTMRIAAGIVVVIMAAWLVRMEVRNATSSEIADTYDDPQMAFEETKKALLMISKSFSTAEEQARKINLFNEARQDVMKEDTKSKL